MEPITAIMTVCSTVGSVIALAVGGFDYLLYCFIAMMAIDVITGILLAVGGNSRLTTSGYFSWAVFRKGIAQKGMMLIVVMIAHIIDIAIGIELLRDVVVLFYLAEEALSALENAEMLGLPLPAKLKQILQVLEEETGSEVYDDETLESIGKS